jgi:hypothetical protein
MIFQVIFIDNYRENADRVVMVEPLFLDYTTAYYTMLSYKYSIFPCVIVQAPDENIAQTFSDAVDKLSKTYKSNSIKDIYSKLLDFIKNQKDIIIMWQRSPGKINDTEDVKAAATKIPLPTELNIPNGINVKAKGIWKFIIRNYREKIRSYTKVEEQWAVAIIIYKRVCYKNNLRPFSYVPISKKSDEAIEEERNKIVNKIQDGYDKSEMLISAIVDNFTSYGWASRIDDSWKYNGVEKATRFSAMLFKDLVLAPDKTYKEINNYLNKNEGFKKLSYEDAELNIDSITSIIFQKHASKANYVYVIVKFSFDKRVASLLFGLEEKASNDEFMKAMQHWVKDKYIAK